MNADLNTSGRRFRRKFYIQAMGKSSLSGKNGEIEEAITILKHELENDPRSTSAFSSMLGVYLDLKDNAKAIELWESRGKYDLPMNEDYFIAALKFQSQIYPDSVRSTAALARNYVPDSRVVNDLNIAFSNTARDSLDEFSRYFKYFPALLRGQQLSFRKSFIDVLGKLSSTSELTLYQWAKSNANKIPQEIRFDIYNQIDLWKFFPMFDFDTLTCNSTNAKDYLESLILSGRTIWADSLLSKAIGYTWLMPKSSLYMYKGDIQFSYNNYSKALGFYEMGLSVDGVRKDTAVLESLIIKTYCCLYLLYKTSENANIRQQSESIYDRFVPTFTARFSTSRLILLDGNGHALRFPYSDFVLGFAACIRGTLIGNTDAVQVGYLMSLSINKAGYYLPYTELNNSARTLMTIHTLIQQNTNYVVDIQSLVTLFAHQYLDLDPHLFGEADPTNGVVSAPENVFNHLDLSRWQVVTVGVINTMPETSAYTTTFRDRIYMGMISDTGNVILGLTSDRQPLRIDYAKTMMYKRFSISNDLYFKKMSPAESKSMENVLWAKKEANDYLSIRKLRDALIEYVTQYPDQTTSNYWLAQVEAALGNSCNSINYINKVLSADPGWEEAVKLRKFCAIQKCK